MSQYQHVKSGGIYRKLGEGRIEADLTPCTIYQNVYSGEIWVRPTAEFNDGRFRKLLPPGRQIAQQNADS